MRLNLSYYSSEPIDNQIVNQVLLRIINESNLPGDELESIGKISRQHHIGQSSVKKAFNKLEQLGVIKSYLNKKYVINEISQNELKKLLEINSAGTINFTEFETLNSELEAARQIQNGLLPKILPNNSIIEVSAYSTISNDVGGDFYDFFEVDKNKYGILIGDASGKGLPAAMLISQIQAIIKSDVSVRRPLKQTFSIINEYLKSNSSSKHFATLFYGVLDCNKKDLRYINAGHNFPILINETINTERLKTTGPALGIMKDANFGESLIKINKNDLLFLFTDGLSERMDSGGLQFGDENILKVLRYSNTETSKKIIEKMKRQLSDFSERNYEIDDTTFMALKIKS